MIPTSAASVAEECKNLFLSTQKSPQPPQRKQAKDRRRGRTKEGNNANAAILAVPQATRKTPGSTRRAMRENNPLGIWPASPKPRMLSFSLLAAGERCQCKR